MDSKKKIAMSRVHILFRLAQDVIRENPQLAQHHVLVARKIAMAARLRLPKEYKRCICKRCKGFVLPGVNCRLRIQPRREPHVVVTCFICGQHTRMPLKRRKRQ